MSHIWVLICRVDDPSADQMTELATFDLPEADSLTLQPHTALDALETKLTPPAMPSCGVSSKRNGTRLMRT
jgi:hypothetical protein